jgi:unsaturated chondroitin disaccharide hydrolase
MQSYGALYSLTGDPAAKAVLLQAAATLSGRFNAKVGAFDHWSFTGPNTFDLVIDGMNDLRPLMWGGANGGYPAWLAEAEQHANTVAGALIRSDGSTFQYATYDATTGQQTFLGTYQGAGNDSDWQRGLTWAINGYADLYYQTGIATYLQIAQHLADHFISVLPSDCVPYWDALDPGVSNVPRDTSAGALGDLGLTKLSVLAATAGDQSRYAAAAQCGLHSLIANGYLAPTTSDAVLQHGNAPDGGDISLIYGDAAFVAALTAQLDLNDGLPISWTMSYDFSPVVTADLAEPGSLLVFLTACVCLAGFWRGSWASRLAKVAPVRLNAVVTPVSGTIDI